MCKALRLLLFIPFFIGCSSHETNSHANAIKSLDIHTEKKTSIQLLDLDISLELAIQYPESHFIYLTNSDLEDSVIIYSLNTKNYKLDKILAVEPPADFEAYYVDEANELVYLFLDEQLAIYDFQNNLIKHQVFGEIDKGYLTNLKPLSFYPFVLDSMIHIEFFPDIEETYIDPEFYQQPFQVMYSLETEKVNFTAMKYPQEYKKKCYGYNFIPDRFLSKNKQQVATFPYNDSAYIYNIEGELIDTKYFGIRADRTFEYIPFDGIDNLQREVFDEFYKTIPAYGLSSYIPFLEYYTRNYFVLDTETHKFSNTIALYDIEWNYLGEINAGSGMTLFGTQSKELLNLKINNENLEIYEVHF